MWAESPAARRPARSDGWVALRLAGGSDVEVHVGLSIREPTAVIPGPVARAM